VGLREFSQLTSTRNNNFKNHGTFRGAVALYQVKAVCETPSTRRNAMSNFSMSKVPARIITAVLAVASFAPALRAQDSGFKAKVIVPFAFQTAAGQSFAPGVYTIRSEGSATMLIQGASTSGLAMTQLANDGQQAEAGKAVFTKYGDKYFLRSVWVAGNSSHLLMNESKAEKRLQVAGNQTPGNVQLALLEPAR